MNWTMLAVRLPCKGFDSTHFIMKQMAVSMVLLLCSVTDMFVMRSMPICLHTSLDTGIDCSVPPTFVKLSISFHTLPGLTCVDILSNFLFDACEVNFLFCLPKCPFVGFDLYCQCLELPLPAWHSLTSFHCSTSSVMTGMYFSEKYFGCTNFYRNTCS